MAPRSLLPAVISMTAGAVKLSADVGFSELNPIIQDAINEAVVF